MKKLFSKLSDKLVAFSKKVTFFISKTVTGLVLIVGSLVGFNTTSGELNGSRLVLAGMIFVFGAPIGLMIFGAHFNFIIWFSLVVTILFAMNLHNTWEVIRSLTHGGLDYVMVEQAVTSISSVTPDEDAIKRLNVKIKRVNKKYTAMSGEHKGYDGNILKSASSLPSLEEYT